MGLFSVFKRTVQPSREDFVAQLVAGLKKEGLTNGFALEAETFRLALTLDGKKAAVPLDQFYDLYCAADADERAEALDHFVNLVMQMAEQAQGVTVDRLRPVVRNRAFFATAKLADMVDGSGDQCASPVMAIGSDLAVALVADSPRTTMFVKEEHLGALGLSQEDALKAALDNLRRHSEPKFTAMGPGVFASGWEDYYDSSRLLLPEVLAGLGVKGDPVAMVPARGTLMVTGADDRQGLITMTAAAAEIWAESEAPLSAQPLRLHNGTWQDFPVDGPDFTTLREALRDQRAHEYAEQAEALGQLCQARGEDIFVATFGVMRPKVDDAAERVSWATWSVDVDTLLPLTDVIGLKTETDVVLVSWSKALPIVGRYLQPTEHYPPRFRVNAFPNDAELDQLRAAAMLVKPIATK
jgi:uncharacterized protein YtpQ (UPF0354 family)